MKQKRLLIVNKTIKFGDKITFNRDTFVFGNCNINCGKTTKIRSNQIVKSMLFRYCSIIGKHKSIPNVIECEADDVCLEIHNSYINEVTFTGFSRLKFNKCKIRDCSFVDNMEIEMCDCSLDTINEIEEQNDSFMITQCNVQDLCWESFKTKMDLEYWNKILPFADIDPRERKLSDCK